MRLVPLGLLVASAALSCGSPATSTPGTHDAAADARAGADAASPYGRYDQAGPATVSTLTATIAPPGGEPPFTVTVYLPGTPGKHPVVVLASGFIQSALAYAPYGERLASFGIAAVLRDDPGVGETTAKVAADVAYTVTTWLGAESAKSGPFESKLDATNVGLAGHSRGGQIVLLAAAGAAKGKIHGVFGLDPVDGSMDGSPLAKTTIATIGAPLTFIGETTDSKGANACAPAADDFEALYAAAASPAVAIAAVGAAHPMFEDPAHCNLCTLCAPGTADAGAVLATSVRYLTAFFARELLGDASVGPTLEGAGSKLDAAAGRIRLVSK